MDAWNAHDLDRILEHYADDVEYYSPFIAQMAEPGGPGADGRLTGKAAVAGYFAAALERNPDLHFEPPTHVAVGAGSICFVYRSIKNLTAVETLVFAPGSRARGQGPLPLPGPGRLSRGEAAARRPDILRGDMDEPSGLPENPRSASTTASTAPGSGRSSGTSPPA